MSRWENHEILVYVVVIGTFSLKSFFGGRQLCSILSYLLLLWQQRLKNWELRERKKARDYVKEFEREDERRREMVRAH